MKRPLPICQTVALSLVLGMFPSGAQTRPQSPPPGKSARLAAAKTMSFTATVGQVWQHVVAADLWRERRVLSCRAPTPTRVAAARRARERCLWFFCQSCIANDRWSHLA
jgi:hypothetical protein